MRLILILACLLASLPVSAATGSAAADTWYVRPVAECPNNGDGLAYNCAASGGASGAFSGFNNMIYTTTTGIDDGDTLKVCGDFVQADSETFSTFQAMMGLRTINGSPGSVITITGNCTAEGGKARASLTSDGTSGSLIRTYASTYLTFTGTFDLRGAKDAGMTLYDSATGDVAIAKNIRVESGTTISNIHGGTQEVGITYSGTDGYIGAVTIDDIGVDGIFEYSGGRWTIDGPRITNISVDTTDGDCVQLQRVVNGDIVKNVYCDKTNVDSKQCVVASCFNAGSATCATGADQTQRVDITDNTCLMKDSGTLSIGIFSEGQAYIERNYITGARTYGVTCDLNNTAYCRIRSNIIVDAGTGCIDVSKTSAGPTADIYNNVLVNCGTYGIDATDATATITARNNSITGTATNGIYRGASGTVDSHNNVFGPATAYSDNGVAGVASTGAIAVDPGFVGGTAPTTAAGFRLPANSVLRNAGSNAGTYKDFTGGRNFDATPSIGAFENKYWYVRPASGEYGLEDGTSLANAFDGTANVLWNSIFAGDALCVNGTYTGLAEADVGGVTSIMLRIDKSGVYGVPLIVDGDCDGDGVKAEFDGNDAVAAGIRAAIPGTSRSTHLTVKNIVLRQFTNKAVITYNVTGDETENAYQTWDGIEVYDHGDGGAGDNGFDSRGRYTTLINSRFSGIDEDAVFHKGKYFRADNIYVRDYSRATSGGDGIQLSGQADGYHVSNFDCAHDRDTKQCFITSVLTDTGAGGIFEDFTTRCMDGASVTNCIFVTGDGAIIRRGYVTGGNYGVAIEASSDSVNMKLYDLIIDGATVDNLGVFTDAGGGNISISNVVSINAGRYAFGGSTGPSVSYRNNIAVNSGTCGFNLAATGQTETYNNSYIAGLDEFCQVGVGIAAGTGSISVDPKFVGGTRPNSPSGFRLRKSSPLIKAGTCTLAVGCIPLDFRGKRSNIPPDIGAFQRN